MSLTVGILRNALKGLDENILVVVQTETGEYAPVCVAQMGIADVDFGDGDIEECLVLPPCECEDDDLINLN
jgi:hypothetical protein